MPTTAELTIINPGKQAEAIMGEIAGFVGVERTDKNAALLTFEHADALSAVPVLATFLRRQGHEDWETYIQVTTSAPTLVGRPVPRTNEARPA